MPTSTARSVARSGSLLSLPAASPQGFPAAKTLVATAHRPHSAAPPLLLAPARTGDHANIHTLLTSVFHGPSAVEFQAQLDEPGYEPSDRWIVKDDAEIAAHLRLARQAIHAGAARLPAVRFMDLATAPAYRSRGLATSLLVAGERAAVQQGAVVALTRTIVPRLFARQGWAVCGSHVFSTAAPRSILAELSAASEAANSNRSACLLGPRPSPIDVRPLRRIEMPAIVRLYEQNAQGKFGWPVRTGDYWDWLLARGAFESIYVAATTSDARDFVELTESIVGYAIVGRSRICELMTEPGRQDVARHLLERICGDAREEDGWLISLDAPPRDPLHELFRRAGGRPTASREFNSQWFMAKVTNPLGALRHLASTFAERAAAADLPLPGELGIELQSKESRSGLPDGMRIGIHLSGTGARITKAAPCRHTVALAASDLSPLVLGDIRAEALLAAGRLRPTTPKAAMLASALFPGGAWWRPPLDDLLA